MASHLQTEAASASVGKEPAVNGLHQTRNVSPRHSFWTHSWWLVAKLSCRGGCRCSQEPRPHSKLQDAHLSSNAHGWREVHCRPRVDPAIIFGFFFQGPAKSEI